MKKRYEILLALILTLGISGLNERAEAGKIEELQERIKSHSQTLEKLEEEITSYEEQIEELGTEAKTLEGAIKTINVTQKKLSTDIKVTEEKISSTDLAIQKLNLEIGDMEDKIERSTDVIAGGIRALNMLDDNSLVETLLSQRRLSSFWNEVDELKKFQDSIRQNLIALKEVKSELEFAINNQSTKRRELDSLKGELGDRKAIVDENRRSKDYLLKDTKNKESNYKKILDEKISLREAFQRELFEIESQLKFTLDQSTLPPTGSGVLRWPLTEIKITQYFGNTAFAKENPQLYNGRGHNGVDLRAPIGTPILAALGGEVIGSGNTDNTCPGASYGKWILIDHGNGLSTLYAHLSIIKAGTGEAVNSGDIIGYSGNSGYSTGPHLHFTVYASNGVQIVDRKSRVCGTTYTMPIAGFNAYLNPLSYL